MLASHPDEKFDLPDVKAALKNFDVMWEELFPAEQARIAQLIIHKITVHPNKIIIEFHPPGMASVLHNLMPDLTFKDDGDPDMHKPMILEVAVDFKKRHRRKIITTPDGRDLVTGKSKNYDNALIKAVVRAHKWRNMLDSGEIASVRALARHEDIPSSYADKIIRLTELAPDITAAIVNGQQPQSLQLQMLTKQQISYDWQEQRETLGFCATQKAA